jgi:ankyrin repeat protein
MWGLHGTGDCSLFRKNRRGPSAVAGGSGCGRPGLQRSHALVLARQNRHTEVVWLLEEAGAYLDARDERGVTALIITSYFGYGEIVRLLVEAGADLNVRDGDGDTALKAALQQGHNGIADLLRAAGAEE